MGEAITVGGALITLGVISGVVVVFCVLVAVLSAYAKGFTR